VLFDLLVKLANAAVDSEKVAEKIADEARDDTRRRWMRSGKKSR
jgi:nitrate reductase delta subunit